VKRSPSGDGVFSVPWRRAGDIGWPADVRVSAPGHASAEMAGPDVIAGQRTVALMVAA